MDTSTLMNGRIPPWKSNNDQFQHSQSDLRSPVAQLPRELIQEIFLLLAGSYSFDSWFSVNRVCKTWRDIAVGTAGLWTQPPTDRHHLTLLMLERSQDADLLIYAFNNTSHATMEAIMDQIHRIRLLSFSQSINLLASSCDLLRDRVHEASRLEDVQIKRTTFDPEIVTSVSKIDFRQLPCLRSVSFWNIRVEWAALPVSRLANLNLLNPDPPGEVRTRWFLKKLAQMPDLERLHLHSYRFRPTRPPSYTDRFTVQLSKLTSVMLQCMTFSHVEAILFHLRMPQLRYLEINIVRMSHRFSTLVSLLSTILLQGSFGVCNNLIFGNGWFSLSRLGEGDTVDDANGIRVSIRKIRFHDGDIFSATMAGLHVQLLSNVTELTFRWWIPSHLPQLCTMSLPSVETISFPSIWNFSFLHSSTTTLFPKLRNIISYEALHDQRTWQELSTWLRLRHGLGAPVQTLGISGLSIAPDASVQASLDTLGVQVSQIDPRFHHAQGSDSFGIFGFDAQLSEHFTVV